MLAWFDMPPRRAYHDSAWGEARLPGGKATDTSENQG